jgi:hypothetical protein
VFTPQDLAELSGRGIPASEAERQVALLRDPPAATRLVRPCTPGDGIEVIPPDALEELAALHGEAAREGRLTKFVPASGAASRMFSDLAAFRGRRVTREEVARLAAGGDGPAKGVLAFLHGLERLPFHDALRRQAGGRVDDVPAVLEAVLDEDGLGLASLPKGLIPFHRYGDDVRTAFEEHLVEAAAYVRDARGVCRLHLTVSPEHRERFEDHLREVRGGYEAALGVRYEVSFSTQHPSTDTLALDRDGAPFRLEDGRLLFRPGGHGALLQNLAGLAETGGDLVYVKNIDNVVPDRLRGPTVTWKRAIAGRLLEVERRVRDLVRLLSTGGASGAVLDEAEALCRDRLHAALPPGRDRAARLLDRLCRPLRVCGVVPNTGEPGGGPFWVREPDGSLSLQIVESAQVDPRDPEQARIFASSTHFSPTDLVCGLRDAADRAFDLGRFVDPNAVLFASKTHEGRPLKALERPGLWNGAMARWNTVFVETPIETFTPVKSVNDLLRPEHQP